MDGLLGFELLDGAVHRLEVALQRVQQPLHVRQPPRRGRLRVARVDGLLRRILGCHRARARRRRLARVGEGAESGLGRLELGLRPRHPLLHLRRPLLQLALEPGAALAQPQVHRGVHLLHALGGGTRELLERGEPVARKLAEGVVERRRARLGRLADRVAQPPARLLALDLERRDGRRRLRRLLLHGVDAARQLGLGVLESADAAGGLAQLAEHRLVPLLALRRLRLQRLPGGLEASLELIKAIRLLLGHRCHLPLELVDARAQGRTIRGRGLHRGLPHFLLVEQPREGHLHGLHLLSGGSHGLLCAALQGHEQLIGCVCFVRHGLAGEDHLSPQRG